MTDYDMSAPATMMLDQREPDEMNSTLQQNVLNTVLDLPFRSQSHVTSLLKRDMSPAKSSAVKPVIDHCLSPIYSSRHPVT